MIDYTLAITAQSPEEAKVIFKKIVDSFMTKDFNLDEPNAINLAKESIGYMAGYYDKETRARVEKLYNCVHPYLGSADKNLSPEEVFQIGMLAGQGTFEKVKQPDGNVL